MFSVVCLFVQWGSHLTITYDVLDLTKQPPSPPPLNRDPPPTPLLLTSGGQDGKHFQTGLHEVVTCGAKTGDMLKLVHLRTPPPPAVVSGGRYGDRAGSTHPTGMPSCYEM